jgi:hypothetical protein
MAFRTSSANLNVRKPPRALGREERQLNRVRSNEAKLEIAEDAILDDSIHGIVGDWLVPAVVDRAMKEILRQANTDADLRLPGYYEHNNLQGMVSDGEKSKGWTANETGPPQADEEAPAVAHGCRIQGAERVRQASESDGK